MTYDEAVKVIRDFIADRRAVDDACASLRDLKESQRREQVAICDNIRHLERELDALRERQRREQGELCARLNGLERRTSIEIDSDVFAAYRVVAEYCVNLLDEEAT